MDAKGQISRIIQELSEQAQSIDPQPIKSYADEILRAKRIFAAGAGRSGLVIRAFAMRLMHLGKEVHILGDASTPAASPGDLLLIGSGSGETASLLPSARKASALGLRIALCTIDPDSTLASLADVVVVLPGASQKVRNEKRKTISIQPMGSSFEQLCLLLYDAWILMLMKEMGRTSDEMFALHANLE